jgi:hemolysin III
MSYEQPIKHFSLTLFLIYNLTTLAIIFGGIKLLFPVVWQEQLATSLWIISVTFVVCHFVNAFIEYFFHRYVLHAKVFPFFTHFYDAHNLHHNLTKVEQKIVTSNRFPIVEEPQHKSSFFPWWTFIVFALFLTPLFTLVWFLFPSIPIFLAGYSAVFFSILLYELFHHALHLPMSFWTPKFASPRYGYFWKYVYTFHLRHHANVRCNESISGFFGIPIPDFLFGTYIQAKTLFPDQTVVPLSEYQVPPPGFFIRTLDSLLIQK